MISRRIIISSQCFTRQSSLSGCQRQGSQLQDPREHEQLDGPKENARYVLIRQHDTFMEYVNTPEESPLLALARAIEKEVGNNK